MRLGNKSTRNEQKGQSLLKHRFFKKRVKFELIRNITHQMISLKESLTPLERATEAFNYPGYVIGLQKEQQIPAKTKNFMKNNARKRCPPNQLNIKVIKKNNKNLRLDCLKVTTFVNQMTPIIVII